MGGLKFNHVCKRGPKSQSHIIQWLLHDAYAEDLFAIVRG